MPGYQRGRGTPDGTRRGGAATLDEEDSAPAVRPGALASVIGALGLRVCFGLRLGEPPGSERFRASCVGFADRRDGGRWLMRAILGLMAALLAAGVASADDPELSLVADRTSVTVGQDFALTVEVSGRASGTGEPDIEGLDEFRVVSTGSSHSFSLSGTRLEATTTFTYRVVPMRAGTFRVGPARLTIGDKTYISQTLDVTVATTPSVPEHPQEPARGEGAVFLSARVDTNKAYVNQQVTLSVLLYSRTQFLDTPRYGPPSTSGFWAEDLPPQLTYRTTVGGKRYDVVEVRTALFPTAPGTYTIGSASVEVTLPDDSMRDPFGFPRFGGFFSSGKKKILSTEPLQVEVLPAPNQGQPERFQGAVGGFTIRASLDRTTVAQNEPVTLTTVVEGTGNLRAVPDPLFEHPPGFRRYPTKGEVTVTKQDYRVGGKKVFATVLVPADHGSFTLQGPRLVFFNPHEGSYSEVVAPAMQLEVSPAPEQTALVEGPGVRGVTVVGEDIGHIKLSATGWTRSRPFPAAPGGWPLQVIPLALVAGGLIWRGVSRVHASSGAAQRRRAARVATARVRRSRRALHGERWRDALGDVAGALDDYLADKLGVGRASLTNDRIGEELRARSCPQDLVAQVLLCRDECNRARFAPGTGSAKAVSLANVALDIIKRLGEHR
jgi:hypothetical protein